jgi:2-C-methyl-D-erythritol 4-phosphate cytidylyltransferase
VCEGLAATAGAAVAAGIEPDLRPRLIAGHRPAGGLHAELARHLGLASVLGQTGDDAAAVAAAGAHPKMVLGERRNLKITTFEDLAYARELVAKGLVGFPAVVRR